MALDGWGRSPPKYRPFFGGSLSPVFTTAVTNNLPPHTMGDDQLRPGMGVFQAMFSVEDHWFGKCMFALTPASRVIVSPLSVIRLMRVFYRHSRRSRKTSGGLVCPGRDYRHFAKGKGGDTVLSI